MAEQLSTSYVCETVAPLPPEYECPICQSILCEPQHIVECGHRYCKSCLEPVLRMKPPLCPLDRQRIEVDKVFLDLACKRAILGLQVKCSKSSNGCEWTGELLDAQKHRKTCPLEEIKCPNYNCKEMIERRNEQRHRQEECVWRKMTCQHCNRNYAFCQEQIHLDKCQLLPIVCRNKCDILVPRRKMTDHISKQCPLAVIKCPYITSGCKVKMNRCELQKHLDQSHSDIIDKRLQDIDRENRQWRTEIEIKWKKLEEQLHTKDKQLQELKVVRDRLNSQERQLLEIKDKAKPVNSQERQWKEIMQLSGRLNEQDKRLLEIKEIMERLKKQERQLKDMNDLLGQVNSQKGQLQDMNNMKQQLEEHEVQLQNMQDLKGRQNAQERHLQEIITIKRRLDAYHQDNKSVKERLNKMERQFQDMDKAIEQLWINQFLPMQLPPRLKKELEEMTEIKERLHKQEKQLQEIKGRGPSLFDRIITLFLCVILILSIFHGTTPRQEKTEKDKRPSAEKEQFQEMKIVKKQLEKLEMQLSEMKTVKGHDNNQNRQLKEISDIKDRILTQERQFQEMKKGISELGKPKECKNVKKRLQELEGQWQEMKKVKKRLLEQARALLEMKDLKERLLEQEQKLKEMTDVKKWINKQDSELQVQMKKIKKQVSDLEGQQQELQSVKQQLRELQSQIQEIKDKRKSSFSLW